MAKCDLSIELADGDGVFRGGDRVRGTVIVRPDGDFTCKGLDISTRWETQGRGNVASGTIETVVAFQGQWLVGQTYRYDFDLASGVWPPTYHGESLTVEHVVRATARLPWKFDPTVAHPFRVYVTSAPESGAPDASAAPAGLVTKAIVAVFFGAIALALLINPFFWCFGAVLGLLGGGWWFFRKVLPSRTLGPVEFRVVTPRLSPGETFRAELVLKPKKDLTLNGIDLSLNAKEICISGSGTNRSTHTATVYEEPITVMAAGELQGGQEHRFPIEATLPMRPIYSMDLDDNDVVWSADLRIDIPRWPDWVSREKIVVVPPAQPTPAAALLPGVSEHGLAGEAFADHSDREPQSIPLGQPALHEEAGVSFQETVNLIWDNREQPDTIDQLVEAVQGLAMNATVKIERRSLYTESDEPSFSGRQGTIFLASYVDPPLPIMLHVPSTGSSQIAEIERQRSWTGTAQIVGYDREQRRLLVKAEG